MSAERAAILADLPSPWPYDLLPEIALQVGSEGKPILVVDDDPTGTQTVAGVPFVASWSEKSLAGILAEADPIGYVLTNSRSMSTHEAEEAATQIVQGLLRLGYQPGNDIELISRGDSTLRGHFDVETRALVRGSEPIDGLIVMPFFGEGGRFTIDGVHHVADGSGLTPVSKTAYAQDPVFGYSHSKLADWIREKTLGRVKPEEVALIDIWTIRGGGPDAVLDILYKAEAASPVVVDGVDYRDVEVVVRAILKAEAAGSRFLARTAASYVPTRAGRRPAEPVVPSGVGQGAGLVIIGSHVPKTSMQLATLIESRQVCLVNLDVSSVIASRTSRLSELSRAGKEVERGLANGDSTVLYTSRDQVLGSDRESTLRISSLVNRSLVDLVSQLQIRPGYLICKGGVTSHSIAVEALGSVRGRVLGPVAPGIPMWQLGEESRFPDLAYVVFPGNVGDSETLANVVTLLEERRG